VHPNTGNTWPCFKQNEPYSVEFQTKMPQLGYESSAACLIQGLAATYTHNPELCGHAEFSVSE
jgi:hypothetical protein